VRDYREWIGDRVKESDSVFKAWPQPAKRWLPWGVGMNAMGQKKDDVGYFTNLTVRIVAMKGTVVRLTDGTRR
jgi:hypothetical protein